MATLWLVTAALLEVGGDALMRVGLRGQVWGYGLGTILLAAYGLLVNLPALSFGRSLGLYIAVFFIVSQALAWLLFGERPSLVIIIGGTLIVAGGAVLLVGGR
ncbi:MAG: hypothetical protein HY724_05140 [Candidatus Rokubacteria bacterium]|nr:hypothetical protein [Candidatus Rokubacteria bacterium]